ncbi:MAG: hypothetical protein OEL81_00245 [Nitrosopumilus sp.]|nr:hypothetical protein [Nitrosopumilus sp.]
MGNDNKKITRGVDPSHKPVKEAYEPHRLVNAQSTNKKSKLTDSQ